jgi:hypothetical protein
MKSMAAKRAKMQRVKKTYGRRRECTRSLDGSIPNAAATICPKCGCQVLDPFGWGLVMHDVTHKSITVAAMPNEKS